MKYIRALSAIGLLTLFAATAWSQETKQTEAVDVTGTWEITSESPRGTMTRNVTFEQQGDQLTGSIETRSGSVPIQQGSIDGNQISFTVVFSRGDNNFEMTYTGTVDGDTAIGTFQTPRGGGPWTGQRVKKEP
ncbi:MAG: hypothetical protein PVI01_06280 [Gemmatimonadales bacterium]|jgi:hypothetical protein